jgi:hypothetical protein
MDHASPLGTSPLGTDTVTNATATWHQSSMQFPTIALPLTIPPMIHTSSPLHLAPHLHVISALTCNTITLAQRKTRTPLPTCNWFDKQWLPPKLPKNTNIHNNNIGSTLHHDGIPDHAHPSYMTMTTLWLSLSMLLCLTLLATFFTSRPRTEWNRKRTTATQRQRQRRR